jgi:hypothetical protein
MIPCEVFCTSHADYDNRLVCFVLYAVRVTLVWASLFRHFCQCRLNAKLVRWSFDFGSNAYPQYQSLRFAVFTQEDPIVRRINSKNQSLCESSSVDQMSSAVRLYEPFMLSSSGTQNS